MSFAADQLYKGYLRQNMSTLVTRVKVREIIIHLPCLTAHDRDTIEAKRETCGNYDGMVLLLDCLKRRENWPEQLIKALEACEQTTIAAEIRAEYNALRGVSSSKTGSSPTTVVRAHVHPAPAASHLSFPESSGNDQAAVAPPPEVLPEPDAQVAPPLEPPTQQQTSQNTEVVSPPDPDPEPAQSTQITAQSPPSTPPPSPEVPHAQVTDALLPQREINSHQEPEENSESDIQDASGDTSDSVSSGGEEVAATFVTAPQQHHQPAHCGTDSPSHPDHLQTAVGTNDKPPQSPSPPQTISDMTDGSSFPTMTPENHPVQDTTPPVNKTTAVVSQPEETSGPPSPQVVERSSQAETTAPAASGPLADGTDTSPGDADDDVCLSKPGQLLSVLPQNSTNPTVESSVTLVEPYSGDSGRLEISEAAPDTVTPTSIPACSPLSSTTGNSVTALPCQENGIAPNHNQPEENHYESPCQSLEVLENVVHVSEVPSILNLDGQTTSPQAEITNRETAKEVTSASAVSIDTVEDALSSLNGPGKERCIPSEPAPADVSSELNSEENTAPQTRIPQSANTKYILTAAGVCACALLIAWRFKK